jgi:hypothetical protein
MGSGSNEELQVERESEERMRSVTHEKSEVSDSSSFGLRSSTGRLISAQSVSLVHN